MKNTVPSRALRERGFTGAEPPTALSVIIEGGVGGTRPRKRSASGEHSAGGSHGANYGGLPPWGNPCEHPPQACALADKKGGGVVPHHSAPVGQRLQARASWRWRYRPPAGARQGQRARTEPQPIGLGHKDEPEKPLLPDEARRDPIRILLRDAPWKNVITRRHADRPHPTGDARAPGRALCDQKEQGGAMPTRTRSAITVRQPAGERAT